MFSISTFRYMALNLPGKDYKIKWDSNSYETRLKQVSTIL
jgi:hypothetical protein